jgi:hypothetical protein
VYRVLVGKPGGKRPLGRPRHRWEDNIIGWIFRKWDVGVWTGLGWLRIQTGGSLNSYKLVSFSRRILLHGVSK